MYTEAVSHSENKPPDKHLGLCIPRTNSRHVSAPLLRRKDIHNDSFGSKFKRNPIEKKLHRLIRSTVLFTSVELCAGGGGQALGLEQAGFEHLALVELDKYSVETLRQNRPSWNVIHQDLNLWDASPFAGTDLVAAGLPFIFSGLTR
jgi:hypothetical protein